MTTKKLQNELENKLDELLVIINEEWNETISPSEEMFFETMAYLHQFDSKVADDYNKKYDDILLGRIQYG